MTQMLEVLVRRVNRKSFGSSGFDVEFTVTRDGVTSFVLVLQPCLSSCLSRKQVVVPQHPLLLRLRWGLRSRTFFAIKVRVFALYLGVSTSLMGTAAP